ncbi:AlpA family transcriptional regulator [Halomonas sp. A11-A]|jgi:predicted DNA-binding transcriptional regulator AlpA|uniref:helix-turn-helix transcriptional regulator n=1 Tax=Halomonas sp. A11-A TaxID=2183985 RepID=UPI000D711D48|nr:AlpA family phage regulatory protein [Halomonas sp. A11-A]PWV71513.1 AlpA family transcriptional regulator [Halomonas sp. A11-A]
MKANNVGSRIVRLKDLGDYLSVSHGTAQQLLGQPGFPGVVTLGPRSKGVLKEELDAWLKTRQG